MRKLAHAVGVEAMSLYNHVASKEDLLDGMIDLVFSRDRGGPGSGLITRPVMPGGMTRQRRSWRRRDILVR